MITGETNALVLQQKLSLIEALTAEIQNAIDAIGSDALDSLEDSVARQQHYASALQIEVTRSRASDPLGGKAAGALAGRLQQAASKLCRLNDEYAALLQHAGRSLRMLQSLYQHAPQGNVDQQQTWSWQG